MRRTGNEQTGQWLDSYRWLAGVLRGESSAAAGEAVPADRYADNPLALLHAHLTRAIAAAIFGDPAGLARHTAAAMPLLPVAAGLYPTAVAHLLRGLALAGQARDRRRRRARRAAVRAGRGDAVAGRPRRGRAGQLPAPAAAARGRAGLGGRRLPRRRPAFDAARREVAAASAPVASGADHRTRGPLLPRPRPRTRRLRPARPGPPAVPRLGRDRESRPDSTGPTRPCDHDPTRPPAHGGDQPGGSARAAPRSPTGTLDLLGILSASQALSSRDQHRAAARPRGRGARRDDRRHRRAPAAVERRPARLAAAAPAGGAIPVSGTGHEHAAADVGAALRPADR